MESALFLIFYFSDSLVPLRKRFLESVLGRDAPHSLEEEIVFYADKQIGVRLGSLAIVLNKVFKEVNSVKQVAKRVCPTFGGGVLVVLTVEEGMNGGIYFER